MTAAIKNLTTDLATPSGIINKIRLLEIVSAKLVAKRFEEIILKKAKSEQPANTEVDQIDDKRVEKLLERIAFVNSLRTAAHTVSGLNMMEVEVEAGSTIDKLTASIMELLNQFAVPELFDNDYDEHLTTHHKNILGMAVYAHTNIFACEQ